MIFCSVFVKKVKNIKLQYQDQLVTAIHFSYSFYTRYSCVNTLNIVIIDLVNDNGTTIIYLHNFQILFFQ